MAIFPKISKNPQKSEKSSKIPIIPMLPGWPISTTFPTTPKRSENSTNIPKYHHNSLKFRKISGDSPSKILIISRFLQKIPRAIIHPSEFSGILCTLKDN
jgi:hypothetical protein